MPKPFTPLLIALPFLMLDAIIEVGLIVETVSFLHARAGKWFDVNYPAGSTFRLHGKPQGLLVDQGHTSNGAAGTAFVLIGIGGLLTIYLERKKIRKTGNTRPSTLFTAYTIFTIVSVLLTLAALIYTFTITSSHANQSISLPTASANPEPILYPVQKWTPPNWFHAVLNLPLSHESDRRKIKQQITIMQAWQWNLVPLFVLGVVVAAVSGREWWSARRRGAREGRDRVGAKIEGF